MAINYAHTSINTPDWKKLAEFYERVFDMKQVPPLRDHNGEWYHRATGLDNARVTGCHMQLPGYSEKGPTLEIFTWDYPDGTSASRINGGGLGHLAFTVDNVGEKLQQLLDEGGGVYGEIAKKYYPAREQTLTLCYAKDPDGNCIELLRWDDGDLTTN